MRWWQHGLSIGWRAAKRNWAPALVLQLVMIGIGFAYYQIPSSHLIFDAVIRLKSFAGLWFSFVAGGIATGVVSEVFRVYLTDRGIWRRSHRVDLIFKFFFMGGMSVVTDLFYQGQAVVFGSEATWGVVTSKVMVDMFCYGLFITSPLQALCFLWKNEGFDWSRVWPKVRPWRKFLEDQILPLWVSCLAFWTPIVFVIYALPGLLQMPLNLVAAAIWGILIVTVTGETQKTV